MEKNRYLKWVCYFIYRLLYFILALFCVFVSLGTSEMQFSDNLRRRFLQEAPRLWKEYRARIQQFDGTLTRMMYVDDKLESHYRFEYKHNASCRMCIMYPLLAQDEIGSVYAYNAKYSFGLIRRGSERPWVLRGYQMRQEGVMTPEMREIELQLTPLWDLLKADTSDVAVLVCRPTFRILRMELLHRESEKLVRMEFDNTHPLELRSKDFEPIQSGVLLFDPGRYWCVRGCELNSKYINADSKITVAIELQDRSDNFPVPKRITSTSNQVRTGGERLRVAWITEYDIFEPSRLPSDEEFTLSAFGLPEPVGVEWEGPVRWYLWLTLAGVVCLVAGGVFYWLSRRRAGGTN
ncbi:MAG: hypothetical protein KatS3mg107_0959 [Gemmataceae bacterium]|nr:MAG: hypothetical protein KatS3mg107_0959 [Gemmataceae bacterium]